MAVASYQPRPHQQHQATQNKYPLTATTNFFTGSGINTNQHQPDFVFAEASNRPSSTPSWSSQQQPVTIPRSAPAPNLTYSSPPNNTTDEVLLPVEDLVPELMNDHHRWQQQQQQGFSTPRGIGHLPVHQRNSSLSTIGSASPSSPFTSTSANAHIAISDSDTDGLSDFASQEAMAAMYAPKQNIHADSFYSQYPSSLSHTRYHQQPHQQHQQSHRGRNTLLPPAEFQHFTSSNPVSVASSIASDSPATPSVEDHHYHIQQQPHPMNKRQKQSEYHPSLPPIYQYGSASNFFYDAVSFNPSVPKLDRTMTDVYSDELYNPNFSITTTVSPSTPTSAVSPNSDVFSQRIHAANNQHLSAAHSPATTISRERSPFRHGSPLAPLSHDLNTPRVPATSHGDMRYQSSQQHQMRDQIKAERDAAAAAMLHHQRQEHIASRRQQQQGHQDPIKRISPQDELLEFNEQSDAADFPLFPQQDNSHHFMDLNDGSVAHTTQSLAAIPVTAHDTSFANFIPTSLPQHYPFMPRENENDMHLAGMSRAQQQQDHQQHQSMQSPTSPQKPSSSSADRGTFSCTYQGCPLRFETAALLQKHKREGHRQAHGLGGRREIGMVPGVTSTQNGPHRCMQINPSTGKPCNMEFSRPYDLTRHEDTIHNPKKKKVTCPACTDKKQFSRGDALSRHYRVCHPELTPPGKRRGGAGRG
ncbi:hypothetical protein MKZ38_008987 [Zalerion maritima]|uniref:C2H2-type domain-containing protein n=1 Tax=Zalerion maritima TaxID=339359 RepID=A0AAD5WNC5_9PEZI|nr:hypothetical protein MKZ38_008987 [Zalerion maritima]